MEVVKGDGEIRRRSSDSQAGHVVGRNRRKRIENLFGKVRKGGLGQLWTIINWCKNTDNAYNLYEVQSGAASASGGALGHDGDWVRGRSCCWRHAEWSRGCLWSHVKMCSNYVATPASLSHWWHQQSVKILIPEAASDTFQGSTLKLYHLLTRIDKRDENLWHLRGLY